MLRQRLSHRNQKDRSKRASHAANVRWERYHSETADREPVSYPNPLLTWHFKNHVTGSDHVITFHPVLCRDGRLKSSTFDVRDNDKPWFTGSRSDTIVKLMKRCPKIVIDSDR